MDDHIGFPIENCTLSTCPILYAYVRYQPDIGGNIFLMLLFTVVLLFQAVFAIRFRTWVFLVGMFCGLVLEIIGYGARIAVHFNPFRSAPFVMLDTHVASPNQLTG